MCRMQYGLQIMFTRNLLSNTTAFLQGIQSNFQHPHFLEEETDAKSFAPGVELAFKPGG